jgi:Antitoxin SocA-like, Panacea domain
LSDDGPREFDQERFEQLALYVAARSANDPRFGKTKLAKILFFSDFVAFTDLGDAITGADYKKLPNGPFPFALNSAIKRIEKRGAGKLAVSSYFGKDQQRLVALRKVDLSRFSAAEISLVDQVIDLFREGNASEVSEFSHAEAAWLYVDDMEEIPYELAWVQTGPAPEDVLAVGKEVAERLGLAGA